MGWKNNSLAGPGWALANGQLALAVLASLISLAISANAGWQRGNSSEEKIILAGVGVIAVLGAHLLLALSRRASIVVRTMALVLWLACMAFVVYGQASYFFAVQDSAGMRRVVAAEQFQTESLAVPKRRLSSILEEQAKLQGLQEKTTRTGCFRNCAGFTAQAVFRSARIKALDAEANEVRRWDLDKDRLEAKRSALHDDPVSMRLSREFGVSAGLVTLVTAGLFSFMLEGLGCLCWYLVLSHGDSMGDYSVTPEVTKDGQEAIGGLLDAQPQSEFEYLVTQVQLEVDSGRVPCTVKAIREHLGCGQGKASEIRRYISPMS